MPPRDDSSAHRTKRKFQPAITNYFARRAAWDDSDDDQDVWGLDPTSRPRHLHHHHHLESPSRESLAPHLPGHVQADLLSVGMRVRKSVPEGYKTHKTSALPSIQTTLSKPSPALALLEVKPPREPVPDDYVHQRELLPFCGLHKIGGFAEQPTTNLHLYAGVDANGSRQTNMFPLPAEAFSQPFSSQGSADSGYSSSSQRLPNPLNPSKRSWTDEDDKPLTSNFFFNIPTKGLGAAADIDEVPVSPLSETPPQSINLMPAVRQFAQPRSRKARALVLDDDMDMDFENTTHVDARLAAGSASDFEEADFLSREVDMGGL